MTSPSKELAEIVINRLVTEELLGEEDRKIFQKKLEEGKLRPEDWKLAIEKTIGKEVSQ